MDKTNRKICC